MKDKSQGESMTINFVRKITKEYNKSGRGSVYPHSDHNDNVEAFLPQRSRNKKKN